MLLLLSETICVDQSEPVVEQITRHSIEYMNVLVADSLHVAYVTCQKMLHDGDTKSYSHLQMHSELKRGRREKNRRGDESNQFNSIVCLERH